MVDICNNPTSTKQMRRIYPIQIIHFVINLIATVAPVAQDDSPCRAAIRVLQESIANSNRCGSQTDGCNKPSSPNGEGNAATSPLVLFLHIPRAAGKTLHSCFLKPALPSPMWCPPSYRPVVKHMTTQ